MSTIWFDICIESGTRVRVDFDLFTKYAPEACEHFRRMCSGAFGVSYRMTTLHSITPGFSVSGGCVAGFPEGQFLGFGRSITRQTSYPRATGPGYLVLNRSSNGALGSLFRITLFDEGASPLPPYECVIGRARNQHHMIFDILRSLDTQDGGEYSAAPESRIVVVDCGIA